MKYRGGSDESHPKETFRLRNSQETFCILQEKIGSRRKLVVPFSNNLALAGSFHHIAGKGNRTRCKHFGSPEFLRCKNFEILAGRILIISVNFDIDKYIPREQSAES